MNNPYYNPENDGLEIIGEIDSDDGYGFNKVVAWKHKQTGRIYYQTDSGCSCPSPFEDHSFTDPDAHTLIEIPSRRNGMKDFETSVESFSVPMEDKARLIAKVREARRTH